LDKQRKNVYKLLHKRIWIILFWLLVWQGIALLVDNAILLVGPIETGLVLGQQMRTLSFWSHVLATMGRIMSGFFIAVLLGVLTAIAAYKKSVVDDILQPFMSFLKTVPVAAFVVLFLIWWKSEFLSTAVVIVVALPLIYISVLDECRRLQRQYFEVAKVYEVSRIKELFYLILPQMKKGLLTATHISLGMSFKSGVAAEIIGTPAKSVGQQMYLAKVSLDTGYLFAYTAAIIFAAFLCEKILSKLLLWCMNYRPQKEKANHCEKKKEYTVPSEIVLHNLSKSYEGKTVFERLELRFGKEEWNYLTWESGAGKTTLFRVLAGLEKADSGEIMPTKRKCALLFQENRLVEDEDVISNVCLTAKSKEEARAHLLQVLDEECLLQKVSALSGGMRRRVALVRAVLAPGEILLLDEPFNGLDEENKRRVKEYIERNRRGRLVIVATHDRD